MPTLPIRRRTSLWAAFVVALTATLLAAAAAPATGAPGEPAPRSTDPGPLVAPGLDENAAATGAVPVIVEVNDPAGPNASTPSARSTDPGRRQRLARQTDDVRGALPDGSVRREQRLDGLPLLALEVTPAGLDGLRRDPRVARVVGNEQRRISSANSVTSIGAPITWASGITGAGQAVAIVDTGVSATHPFLAGKVVAEACFSSAFAGTQAACPGPNPNEAIGPGAGAPCPALPDCSHGTHVAGVVAGGTGGTPSGVAPGATLIAVQVFSTVTSASECAPFPAPCATTWTSDIIRGLEHVHALRNSFSIAAVNLSLGGGQYAGYCDNEPEKPSIDLLRSAGIPTVVASGNTGTAANGKSTMTAPACVSSAVSVGATDDQSDTVPSWSSSSSVLSLLAPGQTIPSSVAAPQSSPFPPSFACPAPFGGGLCANESGTSMSTPHVAGSMALVKAARPAITVTDAVNLLRDTGRPIVDPANAVSTPRIQVDAAVRPPTFHPVPPARILDTRDGTGGVFGAVSGGQTISSQVTGRGGVPATGVSAVVLNVTAASPSAASFVTAFPFGANRPTTSNLNVEAGVNRANLVVAKVGAGGKLSLFNNSGTVHLIADIAGWYDTGGATDDGDRYRPVSPVRVLDSRDGTGLGGAIGPVPANGTITFDPTVACGFAGATAVAINVTAAGPTADTHVTAWPAGTVRPGVSSVNVAAGRDTPNLVIVKVGASGLSLFNNAGEVDVVADLAGCFTTEATGAGRLVSTTPARVIDTRSGLGGTVGPVGSNPFSVILATRGGVPATGATAVVLNVTATETTQATHLTVWPNGQPQPTASNVNVAAGQTAPNLVVVKLRATNAISIANNSGTTQVVADVAGWITS
jgi:subtilisin family serine protease